MAKTIGMEIKIHGMMSYGTIPPRTKANKMPVFRDIAEIALSLPRILQKLKKKLLTLQ